MVHFAIFIYILSFAAGIAVIYKSVQIYKIYYFRFLWLAILYLIFYNFVALLTLTAEYLITNIITTLSKKTILYFWIFGGTTSFIISFVLSWIFIFLGWSLLEKKVPRLLMITYITIFTGFAIIYGFGVVSFLTSGNINIIKLVHQKMNYSISIISIIIDIYILLETRVIIPVKKRKILQKFCYLFLCVDSAFFISLLFYSEFSRLIFALGYFITNFVIFIYMKRFLIGYMGDLSFTKDYKHALENIIQKYDISSREKEIIEMIVDGKSNKEIEQILFISFHTVKNHIYHIFRKTGVTSRSQLINMIFNTHSSIEN